jgi:hypothetical protein
MASSTDFERQQETLSVVQALADETHRPFDDVNRMFAETFEKLDSGARIKDYLVVLTSKTVRDELRK